MKTVEFLCLKLSCDNIVWLDVLNRAGFEAMAASAVDMLDYKSVGCPCSIGLYLNLLMKSLPDTQSMVVDGTNRLLL
jgi:hypothetical protein